jgi:hypothetical protein
MLRIIGGRREGIKKRRSTGSGDIILKVAAFTGAHDEFGIGPGRCA